MYVSQEKICRLTSKGQYQRLANLINASTLSKSQSKIGIIPCRIKRIKPLSVKENNETLKLALGLHSINEIPKELRVKAPKTGKDIFGKRIKNKEPLYATTYNQNTLVLMLAGYVPTLSHSKKQKTNRKLMREWIKRHRGHNDGMSCKARRLKRLNYKYGNKSRGYTIVVKNNYIN